MGANNRRRIPRESLPPRGRFQKAKRVGDTFTRLCEFTGLIFEYTVTDVYGPNRYHAIVTGCADD